VKIPIVRIGARVERHAKAGIDEDADEQHPAIGAGSLDVPLRMVRGAHPRLRLPHGMAALMVFKGHGRF